MGLLRYTSKKFRYQYVYRSAAVSLFVEQNILNSFCQMTVSETCRTNFLLKHTVDDVIKTL